MEARIRHEGRIAEYRWGTSTLDLSRHAPAKGDTVFKVLAATTGGSFRFDTTQEAVASIAVMHELIHLQQDLATGLGAWDHCATRDAFVALIDTTRFLITKYDDGDYPLRIVERLDGAGAEVREHVRAHRAAFWERSIGHPQLAGVPWATPETRRALAEAGMSIDAGVSIDEGAISLRMLFEGEAASRVYTQLSSATADDVSRRSVREHRGLWDLGRMDDVYTGLVVDLAKLLAGGDLEPEDFASQLPWLLAFMAWMIDVACSYPPPSALNEWPGSTALFDPVVRYLLLMKAMHDVPPGTADELLDAFHDHRFDSAERLLLGACPVPYPTSEAVCRRWVDDLAPIIDEDNWDAPLFRVRRDALQHRVDEGAAKGIADLTEAGTPLVLLVEGGDMVPVLFGEQLLPENRRPLVGAILSRASDLELFSLFYESGTTDCVFDRAATCDARVEQCRAISLLDHLPANDCQVRDQLEGLGYVM